MIKVAIKDKLKQAEFEASGQALQLKKQVNCWGNYCST